MNAYSRDILLKRWDTMKRLIGAVLGLTLILPVAPVLAGDTFRAFSRLPATVQASLTPMNEAQLATIKGGQISQSNASTVLVT
jgi:cytochrome bd-type quinol oxidase subunit 1